MKKRLLIWMVVAILCIAGCSVQVVPKDTPAPETSDAPAYDLDSLQDYVASLEERAAELREFLEREDLTREEREKAAKELYELWENALDEMQDALRTKLPDVDVEEWLKDTKEWLEEKKAAAADSEAADILEERVREFYKRFREAVS